jgi:hypothetical protein
MSVSSIFNSTTGKIYEELIPQGGGVPLTKGQLLSALADGTEVAVPIGANGSVLSCNTAQDDGLQWIALPQAIALTQGELISANQAGDTVVVPAPQLPAQANWVLSADAGADTHLIWKPVTGGGGIIDATAPLVDDATAGTNTISINFGASVGEIPYGNGTAKTGALTNVPTAGQILGVNNGVPTWINAGGSGTIVGIAPITEVAGGGNESQIAIAFPADVGRIPYGNGTLNTGALTNAPTAGQILGVSNGVPTWIPAGGSGTVTALAPLTEYADGASSKVAIDFVAKGDLVVGGGPQAGGNPIAGVILTAGTNGFILQANSNEASGLEWVAGGSGGINDGSIMAYNSGISQDNENLGTPQPFSYGNWVNPTPTAQPWTQTGLGTNFTIEDGTPLEIYNPQPPAGWSFFPFEVVRWIAPITLETGQKLSSGTLQQFNNNMGAQNVSPAFSIFDNDQATGQALYTKTWANGAPDFPPFGGTNMNWAFTLDYTHTAPTGSYFGIWSAVSLPWQIPVLVNYNGSGPLPNQPNPYVNYKGTLSITTKDNLKYTGTNSIYVSVNIPIQINTYSWGTINLVDLLSVPAYANSNFLIGIECRDSQGNPSSTEGQVVLGASNVSSLGTYQGLLTWNGFMLQNDYIAIKGNSNQIFNQATGGGNPIYTAKMSIGNISLYCCECGFTPL